MATEQPVTLGLERCVRSPPKALQAGRFGLLANQASVDKSFRYAHDLLSEALPGRLAALFSPQHGFWSTDQDNMIETPHGRHARLQVPIHSLYSETRQLAPELLEDLDCLVVDLQDVGTRVYTYIWTVSYCLEACSQRGIPVVVLDRPNPLGGFFVEGPRLHESLTSFVGRASIPMRHGLTIAEMTLYLNDVFGYGVDVSVVEMEGWQRRMTFLDTRRVWVAPSPNLPRLEGVATYPGTVLLEGTNLSEGRGTTTPFELCGAPFIDSGALLEVLASWELPGVVLRPLRFKPTFQKWQGQECDGVYLHVADPDRFRPYRTSVIILDAIRKLWPSQFRWMPPPFEYEYERVPIDILSGSSALRKSLESGLTPASLGGLTDVDDDGWWRDVEPFLLYPGHPG